MKRLPALELILGLSSVAALPGGCQETELSILTYNIAGLPQQFSGVDPQQNIPKISPLLNDYDIVLIQENFMPKYGLFNETEHPFHLPNFQPEEENNLNKSGLSSLSIFPIDRTYNQQWYNCHGVFEDCNDCLTPKGFTVSEYEVMPGIWIDIYNLHMDAGDSPGDTLARAAQIEQLTAMLRIRSRNKAVIVAGDTNLDLSEQYLFEKLLREGGLRDSCTTLDCPEPYLLDKVLYKNSVWVQIEPIDWHIPVNFINAKGEPLSDHVPVTVDFKIALGNYK
ncbi:MAG: endonuclease/exonuclease/phosphatase family protein [Nanoarchaeota archaeon]